MTMTVDAAIVSRKSAKLDFNTDGVNAAGKIWPRETVHSEKGIRAAGVSKDRPYYVLASSEYKGTAESAADLFKNCVNGFNEDGSNIPDMLAEFFRAFAKVLVDSGFDSSACDFSVFVGANDKVCLGKMGNSRLYRIRDRFCEIVEPENRIFPDGKSQYGVALIDDVRVDDIFLLIPRPVAEALNEDLIEAIYRNADGDIKKIVSLLASQAVRFGCKDAISAIVIRVTEVGEPIYSFVPPVAPVFESEVDYPPQDREPVFEDPQIPEPVVDEDVQTAETAEEDTVSVSKAKKIAFLVMTSVLIVLLLGIIFFAVNEIAKSGPGAPSVTDAASESATAEESTTEPESTTEAESTTEESTSATESESSTDTSTTEAATERQTERATERATERTTERETERETESTTEAPSEEETEDETETPVEETTEEQTQEQTEEDTQETPDEQNEDTEPSPAQDEEGGASGSEDGGEAGSPDNEE